MPESSTAIILGSSRRNGETGKIVDYFVQHHPMPIYDLNDYKISYFDYSYRNREDDYLPLMTKLLNEHDTFIFATPVYWYSMSAVMKTFFDRFSDLLKFEKPTGRQLRTKSMAVISCGYDRELKPGFYMPFIESASYLGIQYLGDVHCWMREEEVISGEVAERLKTFGKLF
jgi:multimeric flavodoxin WrbA